MTQMNYGVLTQGELTIIGQDGKMSQKDLPLAVQHPDIPLE